MRALRREGWTVPHLRVVGNHVLGLVSIAICDLSVACLLALLVAARVNAILCSSGYRIVLWSVAVFPQPRLPLNRAADSEEPPPSPELSGWLMFGVVSQPQCPCSFQCAEPVEAPRVVFLHI